MDNIDLPGLNIVTLFAKGAKAHIVIVLYMRGGAATMGILNRKISLRLILDKFKKIYIILD